MNLVLLIALKACSHLHARLVRRDLVLQSFDFIEFATGLGILNLVFDLRDLRLLAPDVILKASLVHASSRDLEQLVDLRIDLTHIILAQLAMILGDGVGRFGKGWR